LFFVLHQARQSFEKICPGEEFLPKAPNPEDIIFDDGEQSGPGESGFESSAATTTVENKPPAADAAAAAASVAHDLGALKTDDIAIESSDVNESVATRPAGSIEDQQATE
jgi:hypothetical protein